MAFDQYALAQLLWREVVEENDGAYREMFATEESSGKDPYWAAAKSLYEGLDESEREAFFAVLRQTIIDTVSNMLGVFDGSSGTTPRWSIRPQGVETETDEDWSGTMQDAFLEFVEERED